MNKKVIVAGVVVVAVAAVAAGFLLNNQGGGNRAGMAQDTTYAVVKADYPYTGDVSVTSSLTGTVEANDVVYVYAKAGGDILSVNVKPGDVVQHGDVLCEINTEQVETAKNTMDSAQVNYKEAQSTLSRMQILYDGGDLSAQDYEQYQNNVESARLSYESAKYNYDKQVEYSTVTAPIDGKIESCDLDVYDHISQNDELCVISGDTGSRITFYVSQRMLNNLSVGDEVQVVKNSTTYEGWITEISTIVDSDTGLFKIKAELEETDEIAIGSSVKIQFVSDRSENVMLIPVDAIYYSGSKGYVYTYEDGFAKMVSVEVGLYDDENAEIISGLETTDMVVSTWSSNLYEGANIRLMSEVQAEDAAQEQAEGTSDAEGPSTEQPQGNQG
ncbi:MAG: efflux RND transporter periplasmic adaptor subunit [Clostridiales bacterium]|nr:efflux RND transporter periplasmic adaptor subunit [Clostridiales bacterium]